MVLNHFNLTVKKKPSRTQLHGQKQKKEEGKANTLYTHIH